MPEQPDISYRIVTSADNSGLTAHTAAVKNDTVAVEQQSQALKEQLTYTTGNRDLASSFLAGDYSKGAQQEEVLIRTRQEYELAQQLYEKYSQLAASKRLLGVEDAALAEKIALLDQALSTESALEIADKIDTDALAQAKRNLALAQEQAFQASMRSYEALAKEEVAMSATTVSSAQANRILGGSMGSLRGEGLMLRGALAPLASETFPGLSRIVMGTAMYGFNPFIISVLAAAEALKMVNDASKQYIQSAERQAELVKKNIALYDEYLSAVRKVRTEEENYQQSLDRIRVSEDDATAAFEKRQKAYADAEKRTKEVDTAKESAAKAEVERTAHSEIEKTIGLYEIEARAQAEAQRLADAQSREEMVALNDRKANQEGLVAKLAQEEATKARIYAADNKALAEYKAAKKEQAEAEDALGKAQDAYTANMNPLKSPALAGEVNSAQAMLDAANANLQRLQQKHPGESPLGFEERVGTEKARLTASQEELRKQTEALHKLDDTFKDDLAKIQKDADARAQADKSDREAQLSKTIAALTAEGQKIDQQRKAGAIKPEEYAREVAMLRAALDNLGQQLKLSQSQTQPAHVRFYDTEEVVSLRAQLKDLLGKQRQNTAAYQGGSELQADYNANRLYLADQIRAAAARLNEAVSRELSAPVEDFSKAFERYNDHVIAGQLDMSKTVLAALAKLDTSLAQIQKQVSRP